MFTVLILVEALCLNMTGQRKYSCQKFDQAKALLERGQNWSPGPNFDHFAQSEWSFANKRQNTGK